MQYELKIVPHKKLKLPTCNQASKLFSEVTFIIFLAVAIIFPQLAFIYSCFCVSSYFSLIFC